VTAEKCTTYVCRLALLMLEVPSNQVTDNFERACDSLRPG